MADGNFDVVVVGGGPAGMAAAITLARRSPLRTLVVERSHYETVRAGETLSPGATGLLEYLGVLDSFMADGHLSAYGTIAVWGQSQPQSRDFITTPFGAGFHLNRRVFDAGLAAAAEEAGSVVWRDSTIINVEERTGTGRFFDGREKEDGRFGKHNYQIKINRGVDMVTVLSRFIIIATGRAGGLTAQFGGHRKRLDRHVAILRTARLNDGIPVEAQTLVEACALGWWYSAFLPNKTAVAGLMTDGDLVRQSGILKTEIWTAELAKAAHTSRRFAGAVFSDAPRTRDAGSGFLSPMWGTGWIALGDTAVSHDPLSSSGIVRAIDSGIYGARAVARVLQDGDYQEMVAYEKRMLDGFQQFVAGWRLYYAMEQRFPQSRYWLRRQRIIKLDPRAKLVRTTKTRVRDFPIDLARVDIDILLETCVELNSAREVVSRYRSKVLQAPADSEIIFALQWLMSEGHVDLLG